MLAVEALGRSLSWEHERVHLVRDPSIGLEAAIAIHSTVLGPALGGLRIRAYEGGMAEALDDVLRLSRAMTLKAAAAGLDLGGGKAVIVDRDDAAPREERLAAVAREIERLDGAYITGEDIGTTAADMDFIARYTSHVVGRNEHDGVGGDPSPDTARTVFGGIRAAFEVLDGEADLTGRLVGVLGLGKVGGPLAGMLIDAGAHVIAYDPAVRDGLGDGIALASSAEDVLTADLDVLAPCAVGGVIDSTRATKLRCRVVCGAANNPLTGPAAATVLARRGILYVPDFLANCGGLIRGDTERLGRGVGELLDLALEAAQERTREVLAEAVATGESPAMIAEARALSRLRAAQPAAQV